MLLLLACCRPGPSNPSIVVACSLDQAGDKLFIILNATGYNIMKDFCFTTTHTFYMATIPRESWDLRCGHQLSWQ